MCALADCPMPGTPCCAGAGAQQRAHGRLSSPQCFTFSCTPAYLSIHPQELLDAVQQCGGRFLLTADHGNAEDMVQVAAQP